MFVNKMPRYEILSEEAMATLDRGWRRIVSEIGVEFILPEAVEVFAAAGQQTEDAKVWLDPDFVMEQVAQGAEGVRPPGPQSASRACTSAATGWRSGRSTARRSCATATCAARRRWPTSRTSAASRRPSRSSTRRAGRSASPTTSPLDSRHLDMVLRAPDAHRQAVHGLGDVGPERRRHDRDDRDPATAAARRSRRRRRSSRSSTSTRRFATTTGCWPRCSSTSAPASRSCITPFLLMGAMSPVSVPASLVQQMAEGLAGIALAQLLRPGCPVVFGSFLSNTDMQSGSPSFGTPESAVGLLLHRPDRAQLRAAVALGRRADAEPDGRRPGRLRGDDDDAPDVPRRGELGHALGRLARVGARVVLREVRRRHRDPADAAGGVHAARGRRGQPRVRRPPRGRRRAATSSARRTRSSGSATASTGRSSPPPRTSSGGTGWGRATPPSGPARSGGRRSRSTSSRPSTRGCGPSSRPTSPAAGRSSATRNGGTIMRLAGHYERLGTERAFEVLARARALEAQGRNIIHLEIGEPDFDTPPHVVEAGRARAPRGPHPLLPGAGPARAARGGGGAPHADARRRRRPGPRAGRARREVVPLLRRPRRGRRRRRGDLPEPGLPDLRVGDQLVGRHGGAAPDHRGDRVRVHRRRPRGAAHAADADGHPELAGQPDRRRARPRAERRDRRASSPITTAGS